MFRSPLFFKCLLTVKTTFPGTTAEPLGEVNEVYKEPVALELPLEASFRSGGSSISSARYTDNFCLFWLLITCVVEWKLLHNLFFYFLLPKFIENSLICKITFLFLLNLGQAFHQQSRLRLPIVKLTLRDWPRTLL